MKISLAFIVCGMLLVIIGINACKKDPFINPYDDPALDPPASNPNPDNLNPSNFAYLHSKIFKPTCANSGCHDGTFPPDYRSINSAYNTLVYQKPVNSSNNVFKYRVYPYKADSSILFHRMNVPMGSGIMPLVTDPQSDWPVKKNDYLNDIKNWINAGAKDMFGNYPQLGNLQPQITGFLSFPAGNTSSPFPRGFGNIVPIEVPPNSSIDLWFLVEDDSTAAANISYNICNVSTSLFNFTVSDSVPLTYSSAGLTANDFSGNAAQFTHKATISTAPYPIGTYLYLRIKIDDNSQDVITEIPNEGTGEIMSGYFALKIKQP